MSAISWIAVDWGTTQLRAWGLTPQNEVLYKGSSPQGMGSIKPHEFESVLLHLIADWLVPDQQTIVIACGMVGARQGWVEAPYMTVPCQATGELVMAPTSDPRLRVYICPGAMQTDPADVMRGEETQIAGILAQMPEFKGMVCLPGTHTKWAYIADGIIRSFTTFMSGELFSLLGRQSVLSHSVMTAEFAMEAFHRAVGDISASPSLLAAKLFAIRSNDILFHHSAAQSRAELSGLLIGAELQAVTSYYLGDDDIIILGSDSLAHLYRDGLSAMGKTSTLVPGEAFTLFGLQQAYHLLQQRSI